MKFVLTGGGTGGHVYPALAIADSLKSRYPDAEFLYVGIRGRAEEKIVPELGYRIAFVTSAGVAGSLWGKLAAAVKIGFGCIQALAVVAAFRPDAVIGTGGYASVPAVLGTALLRKLGLSQAKIFIHEQNYAPGRWNRMISRRADSVWTSFVDTKKFLPGAVVEFTGYPVRSQIVPGDKNEARRRLGLDQDSKVLMVFGGSQGARSINYVLTDVLPELLRDPKLVVIHGTGAQNSREYDAPGDTAQRVAALGLDNEKLSRYRPYEYFREIQDFYAAADLLICRGGAGTLNELLTCGKPSIIIPKSSLAGEHQAVNALALAKAGAAEVIFERPVAVHGHTQAVVDPVRLAGLVASLLADSARLESISRAAFEMRVLVPQSIYADSLAAELEGRAAPPELDSQAQPAWGNIEAVRLAGLSPAGVLAHARKTLEGLNNDQIEQQPNVKLMRYLADIYLVARGWQVRNIGIKLAGLSRCRLRRQLLMELAGNRNPPPMWKRLVSRDFSQNGFIRRNAITSLLEIGEWDEALEKLLASCLSEDPYYEVRVEAARCIVALKNHTYGNKLLTVSLLGNISHSSLEVRWCCVEALGVTAQASDLAAVAPKLALHPNWKIRQSLLLAVETMLERGAITTGDPLWLVIASMIPTCTDFNPSYPLKRALNRLKQMNLIESGKPGAAGGGKADR